MGDGDGRTGHDSFVEFARHRQAALWRFAYLLCHSRAEADDLVQEALARMYPRWHVIGRPGGSPEAYARTVIIRVFVSTSQRLKRELLVAEHDERGRVADPWPEPSTELLAAVRALPRKQRAVVVLTYWADHSDDEIASMLGCAAVTVRTNRRKALARLRLAYRGSGAGWQMATAVQATTI